MDPTPAILYEGGVELQEVIVIPRNVKFTRVWYHETDTRCAALIHSLQEYIKQERYSTVIERSFSNREDRRQCATALKEVQFVQRRIETAQRIREWVQGLYSSDEDLFNRAISLSVILDRYEAEIQQWPRGKCST